MNGWKKCVAVAVVSVITVAGNGTDNGGARVGAAQRVAPPHGGNPVTAGDRDKT